MKATNQNRTLVRNELCHYFISLMIIMMPIRKTEQYLSKFIEFIGALDELNVNVNVINNNVVNTFVHFSHLPPTIKDMSV